MQGAPSSVGTDEAEHAGYHADEERIAPYAWSIQGWVEEEDVRATDAMKLAALK
jgi:hypothetical protein